MCPPVNAKTNPRLSQQLFFISSTRTTTHVKYNATRCFWDSHVPWRIQYRQSLRKLYQKQLHCKTQTWLPLICSNKIIWTVLCGLFCPLFKTAKWHQDVVVVDEHCATLPQVVRTARIRTNTVTEIFWNAWVISYGIAAYLLTNNGIQPVAIFFETLCNHFATKHLTTTEYDPQTNSQMERYNKPPYADC